MGGFMHGQGGPSHGGSGHGGHAAHGGAGHALGQIGTHGAGGHNAGGGKAGSHSAGHSVRPASSHSTSPSGSSHGQGQHSQAHTEDVRQALAGTTKVSPKVTEVPSLYLKILDVLSPTKLSFFLFLFGAIGTVSLKFLPGFLSLAPALIIGWVLANLFFNILGTVLSKLGSSTNFKKESLIGSIGSLTLSIQDGSVGEVLLDTHNSRYSSAARTRNKDQSIKKLAKVIVVDIQDGIFIVEPFDEQTFSVNPSFNKE